MRKVCADFGAEPRELNNQDDHAHLLADDPPNVVICAPVNSLNGVPARRPRTEFTGQANPHIMHGHFWSPSYLTASRRGAPPGTIRQYTKQQRRPVNTTSGLTPP